MESVLPEIPLDELLAELDELLRGVPERSRERGRALIEQLRSHLASEQTEQLHEAVRESEARLVRAQELAKLGNFKRRFGSDTYDISPELYRIFGIEQDTNIDVDRFFSLLHPEDRGRLQALIASSNEGAVPPMVEYRIICPDGTLKYVQARADVVLDESGQPSAIFGTVQDQTERKLAEERQRNLERRLNEAKKRESLGLIAGGVAHDLNNLLAIIQSSADLLQLDLPADSAAQDTVRHIVRATARAAQLAHQMLIYAGRGLRVVTAIDLNELLREMSASLSASVEEPHELRCVKMEGLPLFDGDERQSRQLIEALVANAVEALPDDRGVVTLTTGHLRCSADEVARLRAETTSYVERLSEGDYVYLEVSDTGHGMEAETVRRIFEPFFSTKLLGRGLALAAVQGIVRGNGGAIQVQSQPGVGTTIRVLFPAREPTSDPAHPVAPSAESLQVQ